MQAVQNRSLLYETTESNPLPKVDLVPPDVYAGQLVEVRPFTNAWGDRIAFIFQITEGKHMGKNVILSTATTMSRKSRQGKTIAALLGRELSDAEALYGYDPKSLTGTPCRLVLGQAATKAGKPYNTVENILR